MRAEDCSRLLPELVFGKGGPGQAPGDEALLLARQAGPTAGERILEPGCGQGATALLLAAMAPVRVCGLELHEEVLAVARANEATNRAQLRGSVEWRCGDLRDFAGPGSPEAERFDLVLMNPPFYRAGSGRLPPDRLRAVARHELEGDLADWLACAARALRPGGRLLGVLPRERERDWAALLRTGPWEGVRLEAARDEKPGPWRLALARRTAEQRPRPSRD